LTACVSEMTVY